MQKLLKLKEWNEQQPVKRCYGYILKAIKRGDIFPPPIKFGKEWCFEEKATYRMLTKRTSLMERINGETKKQRQ
ncbi:Excisionase-like protein [Edwardsiella tarda ATCC 23685]|uniref:Excisionase-like protein n=1 Tax=Edwardsiella tarda ATCC 23685 TaxID=500638 RepID=D4F530_EDWTA|nr:excisionase [Edwardsiella tarda]EFE23132.1 Excisionase-like protein [Edwardsiella tarda ATCC 23685]UCQ52895.1 hypothetical protein DCF75_08860 [Edwardsiella tarda]STD45997.1 Excisionase-like protein [Edwardsiella tarda]BEH72579.1 hypothetical protein GBS0709_16960 [Edwardsiella tarda]GAC63395.1 hypothetical protein ET1_05_00810 [Edwardsiella tarda ATCC 15947 = NBRC 105688]